MMQPTWATASGRTLVCVDSYEQGVLKGRFYNERLEGFRFESLMQFLSMVEQELDAAENCKERFVPRSFGEGQPVCQTDTVSTVAKGRMATFELQVLFRQHSSWQGVIYWREQRMEQSFRSALELMFLMDSALRSHQGIVE